VESRYGLQADKVKVCKKHYKRDMESCVLSGRSEMLESILKRHFENPYGTVDEIIGDLQLELVDSWNDFHKLWPTVTRSITLEAVLKDHKMM